MKIGDTAYRSIWVSDNGWSVHIFDQRKLPWKLEIVELTNLEEAALAINDMWTRGAPLLAMTAAYGICLAMREDPSHQSLDRAYKRLLETRPTAVNLRWALERMRESLRPLSPDQRADAAYACAGALCDEDVKANKAIGDNGLPLIKDLARKNPERPVHILTHCNAGWLATVDYGTVTAPIYMAHDQNIPVHVWVSETRPRNQGGLTAFELGQHGVPHTMVVDNAAGLLMQQGKVDICLVGADRVTSNGDTANKIGTYLKALAAYENGVPFYVALPVSSIDWTLESGRDIPIEMRSSEEVKMIQGLNERDQVSTLALTDSPAFNPGFDITPAKLITGYITDRGVVDDLSSLQITL